LEKRLDTAVKQAGKFIVKACFSGLLLLVPVYLSFLLLQKAARSLVDVVRPVAELLPNWLPAETVLSILLVLIVCFLIGAATRSPLGHTARERVERSLFEKLPGYALFRSLTQQVAGDHEEQIWKPAMVEIEEALVPGFVIEQFDDGRFTVFVPSAPTPLSGAVYVLPADRVHLLEVPFTQAIRTLAQWGLGSKELVSAMRPRTLGDRCNRYDKAGR
jgi:uncharacterized membrane protein